MDTPKIKLEDIIRIGDRTAIVSNTYSSSAERIEIIYFGDNNVAYYEDVIWKNDKWEFIDGSSAGYADNNNRTKPYIEKLNNYLYLKSRGLIS